MEGGSQCQEPHVTVHASEMPAEQVVLCCAVVLVYFYMAAMVFSQVYTPSWYLITDSQMLHLGMAPAVHRSHKENLMSFLGFACNREMCMWHRAAWH